MRTTLRSRRSAAPNRLRSRARPVSHRPAPRAMHIGWDTIAARCDARVLPGQLPAVDEKDAGSVPLRKIARKLADAVFEEREDRRAADGKAVMCSVDTFSPVIERGCSGRPRLCCRGLALICSDCRRRARASRRAQRPVAGLLRCVNLYARRLRPARHRIRDRSHRDGCALPGTRSRHALSKEPDS